MVSISYYNLTGGLNTLQGIGTINQTAKRTESPDMQNVEYFKMGGVQSMLGNKLFADSDFGSPITLGYEYIYNDQRYLIVCLQNGEIYIYLPLTQGFELIYTFDNVSTRHSICNFNNGVVISNGIDDLVFYQYGRHQLLTGAVNTTADSTTVLGVNTEFESELQVGDTLYFGEDEENRYTVTQINSDTSIEVEPAVTETLSEALFYLGEISQCNAALINSNDENINTEIRGLALASYQGRIFVGGNDGVLYYSEVGLYNGWDIAGDAGGIDTFYNDNSSFTALAEWDKYLVLFRRERSYLLDGTDSDSGNWSIDPFSVYTCMSQQSWIDCNSGLYMYTERGGGIFPVLQRTIYSPNYQGYEISAKIKSMFDNINHAYEDYIFPVYAPKKQYLMFYVPLLTGIGSNTVLIYDLFSKSWLIRKVPQQVNIAFRYDDEIYIGTTDGHIYKEFSGLTFNGEPIEFYWCSPWFNFGRGTDYMSSREIRLKMSEEYTNKFYVRNHRDGSNLYKERLIDTNRGAFIGLVWDVGYNPDEQYAAWSITKPSFPVTALSTDGGTYYTTGIPTEVGNQAVPEGAPIYSDKECTDRVGFAGLINYEAEINSEEDADRIQRVQVEGYSWTYSHSEFVRYENEDGDYIWVWYEDGHPTAGTSCVISEASSGEVELYALYGWVSQGNGSSNVGILYITPSQYQQIQDAMDEKGPLLITDFLDAEGNPAGYGTLFVYNYGRATGILSYNNYTYLDLQFAPEYNITKSSGVNSGDDPYSGTVTTITSASGSDDDGWTVVTPEGTFSNMTNPTNSGNTITGTVYTTQETLTDDLPVYSNEECTSQAGTVNTTYGDNYILLNGYTRVVSVESAGSYNRYIYKYYQQMPIQYVYMTERPSDDTAFEAAYAIMGYKEISYYQISDGTNTVYRYNDWKELQVGDTVFYETSDGNYQDDIITSITVVNEGQPIFDTSLQVGVPATISLRTESGIVITEGTPTVIESDIDICYYLRINLSNLVIYRDPACTKEIGMIGTTSTSITQRQTQFNVYNMVINAPGSTTQGVYCYAIPDPTKIELEDLTDYEHPGSITDTLWNEDAWVIANHVIKRFPIPDQYFTTLQLEFYGNATDEGMALYGFEIDGVELEEVPYR